MEIDLSQFKIFLENLSEHLQRRVQKLNDIIDISSVDLIYPKKMFVNDNIDLNLFLFTKTYIYSVVLYPDIKVHVIRKNDITNLDLRLIGNRDPDYELIITLMHGAELKLFNVEDTNDDWRYHFSQYVLKVYKYLLSE